MSRIHRHHHAGRQRQFRHVTGDDVRATATRHRVVSFARDKDVIAAATGQRVVAARQRNCGDDAGHACGGPRHRTAITQEHVVARRARHVVVTRSGDHDIVAGSGVNRVVAPFVRIETRRRTNRTIDQRHCAVIADDNVRASAGADRITESAGHDHVVTAAARHRVGGSPRHRVARHKRQQQSRKFHTSVIADDRVATAVVGDRVAAVARHDHIVARADRDRIVAGLRWFG